MEWSAKPGFCDCCMSCMLAKMVPIVGGNKALLRRRHAGSYKRALTPHVIT